MRVVPLEIVQFLVAYCGPGPDEYKQTKIAVNRIRAYPFVFVECVLFAHSSSDYFMLFYETSELIETKQETSSVSNNVISSLQQQISNLPLNFRLKWQSIYGVRVRATDSA